MSTTSRLPRCFRLLLLLCGLAGTHGLRAQVQVTEEPGITRAIAQWKQYNLEHAEVRGWRVQISATTDRRQMETNKRLFERIYPDFPLVFVHNEPYYHLKAGAFLYNRKAQAFLHKMQADFPGAILVTDNLKTEELLLYDQ